LAHPNITEVEQPAPTQYLHFGTTAFTTFVIAFQKWDLL